MHHGHPPSTDGSDLGDAQPDLHVPVLSDHGAHALVVEPLVDSGIVLARLIRQEHAVYGDVVMLWGGGEQLAVLGVLAFLQVPHEPPDRGLVLPSDRTGVRRPGLRLSRVAGSPAFRSTTFRHRLPSFSLSAR